MARSLNTEVVLKRWLIHRVLILLFLFGLYGPRLPGQEVAMIAVASNFKSSFEALLVGFSKEDPNEALKIQAVYGSTNKHYTQILKGAPYHGFFAADQRAPQRLIERGLGLADSKATYAEGRIAIWSPTKNLANASLRQQHLQALGQTHLAIANPRFAPYGQAARSFLERIKQWPKLGRKLVKGANIAQTYQFVDSGAAKSGIVAYSQLLQQKVPVEQYWLIPKSYHTPIIQDRITLRKHMAFERFLKFLETKKAQQIIQAAGYQLPPQVRKHDG